MWLCGKMSTGAWHGCCLLEVDEVAMRARIKALHIAHLHIWIKVLIFIASGIMVEKKKTRGSFRLTMFTLRDGWRIQQAERRGRLIIAKNLHHTRSMALVNIWMECQAISEGQYVGRRPTVAVLLYIGLHSRVYSFCNSNQGFFKKSRQD